MKANAKPFCASYSSVPMVVPTYMYPQSTRFTVSSGIPSIINQIDGTTSMPLYGNSSIIVTNPHLAVWNYCKKDFNPQELPEYEKKQLRESKLFSIDVECVATGYRHCDRDVARIAVVNALCETIFESFVKPEVPIVSYLTPLTGITKEDLDNAPSLAECMKNIRKILPKDSVLVGQGIGHDVNWLKLKHGEDFKDAVDLLKVFAFKEGTQNNYPKITSFSLRQEVLGFMGVDIQSGSHNPQIDAIYSMKLYLLFRNCNTIELNVLRTYLNQQPRLPSFAKIMAQIDGVDLKRNGKCVDCRDAFYKDLDIDNPLYH